MKALTIIQPYASLIMSGVKSYEMRNWKPKDVTEFIVHAGAKPMSTAALLNSGIDRCFWDGLEQPLGAMLGVVRIVAFIPTDTIHISNWHTGLHPLKYKYAWRLEVVKVFNNPIPARGKLGMWEAA